MGESRGYLTFLEAARQLKSVLVAIGTVLMTGSSASMRGTKEVRAASCIEPAVEFGMLELADLGTAVTPLSYSSTSSSPCSNFGKRRSSLVQSGACGLARLDTIPLPGLMRPGRRLPSG